MKTKTLVLAAVMFLGLGAAAFAQATFSVGSIPVTAVISTGLTELTGDVTFNVAAGSTIAGTITINYGVPITVSTTAITVSTTTGSGGSASINSTTSNTAGTLVITVPAGLVVGDIIRVSGVRVAVAGTTLTSLNASISATGNAITAGQTSVTVINSIAAGIASVGTAADKNNGGAATINSVTGAVNGLTPPQIANIAVKEGFISAWNVGTNLRVTLTGLPPANVTLTMPLTATTNAGSTWKLVSCTDLTDITTAPTIKSSSSSPASFCYQESLAGSTAASTQEVLLIPVNVAPDTGKVPFSTSTITYTVTLYPIGTAFSSSGGVLTAADGIAGYIPRFVQAEVGPATLLTVTGTSTTLLMPFAQVVSSAGYDTGIAIANTTTDPGSAATGITPPVKQAGAITFFFFPQASAGTVPASFSYTTSASSPGSGLNSSGQVASGSTYVVLLSQLLSAASAPANFSGYIFAVAGFTNAHGLYVISNFSTFSQGSLMPVILVNRASFSTSGSGTSVAGESTGF